MAAEMPEKLAKRYLVGETLDQDAITTTYSGQDTQTNRKVAIRVLNKKSSKDSSVVTQFLQAARRAGTLAHPNILTIYDCGYDNWQEENIYFIVMPLVHGTSLYRYLGSRGAISPVKALIIAHDVALGLASMHRRGIVHGAVKPENVWVGRDGSIALVISITSTTELLIPDGLTLRSTQYCAPEQARKEIVSPAADVYACGVMLYEMLTGQLPFDEDTPAALILQLAQDQTIPLRTSPLAIPQPLQKVITRSLEREPVMRYRDGYGLAYALEQAMDNEAPPAQEKK